jgi:hypothetical protein
MKQIINIDPGKMQSLPGVNKKSSKDDKKNTKSTSKRIKNASSLIKAEDIDDIDESFIEGNEDQPEQGTLGEMYEGTNPFGEKLDEAIEEAMARGLDLTEVLPEAQVEQLGEIANGEPLNARDDYLNSLNDEA